MMLSTVILWLIALVLAAVAWRRSPATLKTGLQESWRTFRRSALLMGLAFGIVGYITILAPQEFVRAWIGPQSGWKGLLLGEAAGIILPGGPYVVFPLIAVLYQAGSGLGPMISMITSWSTLAFISLSFELPFLGWRFSLVRITLTLIFPVLVGWLGQLLFA